MTTTTVPSPGRRLEPRHRFPRPWEVVRITGLAVFTLVVVVLPLYVLFINSAKSQAEGAQLGLSLPTEWHLIENYSTVWVEGKVLTSAVNTVILIVPVIVVTTLVSSASAWVFARRRSMLSSVLYTVCICGVILPPMLLTTIFILQTLGLYGSFPGAILAYIGGFSAISIFLITGFVRSVPTELEEAGRLDGAGSVRLFFSVVLPLLRPVLFTTSVFLFLLVWNDLLFQFFMLGGRGHDTLSLGLFEFAQVRLYETAWNLVFADVFIVSMPPLIIFFFAQRRILSGLTAGALSR